MMEDHPRQKLDSVYEKEISPADGIVHRYPDKVLFLPEWKFLSSGLY
jgi:lysine 2,3-aminomutase